jgi:ribosome-associated heat shock protein Hsp15
MIDTLRIDKWLYHCRLYKTRTLASKAVSAGHVKVNGERPAPGRRVKVGDRITLVRERLTYALEVLSLPARRGPAAEARRCYREDEEVAREREEQAAALKLDRQAMPRTDGRPDKRTRRLLRKEKGSDRFS